MKTVLLGHQILGICDPFFLVHHEPIGHGHFDLTLCDELDGLVRMRVHFVLFTYLEVHLKDPDVVILQDYLIVI